MRVLGWAVNTPAHSIGMIGSKRKVLTVCQELQKQGVSSEKLKRAHAPIGLNIGATTPEAVPFPKTIYETSSMPPCQKRATKRVSLKAFRIRYTPSGGTVRKKAGPKSWQKETSRGDVTNATN